MDIEFIETNVLCHLIESGRLVDRERVGLTGQLDHPQNKYNTGKGLTNLVVMLWRGACREKDVEHGGG